MTENKPWRNLPKVEVIQENLEDFYKFICERQQVWHRRFVLKLAPPWTEDKWLLHYKFTNVYRELDRGTLWLLANIIMSERRPVEKPIEVMWEIMAYRILNKVETFEAVGLPFHHMWKEPTFRRAYRKKLAERSKVDSVFTSAHLTLPTPTKGASKIDTYIEALNELHRMLPHLYVAVTTAETLEQVWRVLKTAPCIGEFIAYEIAVDFIYAKLIPFSEDDWANAGPGCKFGIRLIYPLADTKEKFLEIMKNLRDNQKIQFARLHLDMPYFNGKPLSLRNIEHSLCEYGKYWKLKNNCGKVRQLFKPKSSHELYSAEGQIPLFPEAKC